MRAAGRQRAAGSEARLGRLIAVIGSSSDDGHPRPQMFDFDDASAIVLRRACTRTGSRSWSARSASVVLVGVIAWRLGWFAVARRHPARTGLLAVLALTVALPIGYYTASPLWIRTELVEPDPVAAVETHTLPSRSVAPSPATSAHSSALAATPVPTTFVARKIAAGRFQRHRRLPLRQGDRHDHRDRARRLPPSARRLLRPQWSGPLRLPLAGGR